MQRSVCASFYPMFTTLNNLNYAKLNSTKNRNDKSQKSEKFTIIHITASIIIYVQMQLNESSSIYIKINTSNIGWTTKQTNVIFLIL